MYFYVLLGLAAAVRIPGIVSAPFWSDEYFSWLTATQPTFAQFFLRCVGVDVYPPLSYFPVWIIAKFSDAQWALRLPSALAGVLCVWVAVRMLRRYVTEHQALALGALIALAPLSVYLGWEAKAYNFFALMNLLMLDEALRLLESPARGTKRLAFWVAASMWSFFLSPYFIVALLAGAWWQEGGGLGSPAFKRVWKGCWVGALWALPLAPFFVKTLLLYAGSSAYNTALGWAPLYSFENFSVGFWAVPQRQAVALAAFAAAVAMLLIPPRATEGRPATVPLGRMLAALAFIPPALTLAVSFLAKPNYNDRAMLISAFAWILLAGLGALRLRGPLAALMLAALLLTQASALLDYQARPPAQRVDYSEPWKLVTSQWKDGDVIMHAYFESGLPFEYYAAREFKQGWTSAPRPNYIHQKDLGFSSDSKAQGIRALWRRVNAWLAGHGSGVYAGLDPCFVDGEKLDDVVKGAKRVWMVVDSDEAVRRQMMQIPNGFRGGQPVGRSFNFADEAWLRKGFRFRSQFGDDEVHVYLYDRKT